MLRNCKATPLHQTPMMPMISFICLKAQTTLNWVWNINSIMTKVIKMDAFSKCESLRMIIYNLAKSRGSYMMRLFSDCGYKCILVYWLVVSPLNNPIIFLPKLDSFIKVSLFSHQLPTSVAKEFVFGRNIMACNQSATL